MRCHCTCGVAREAGALIIRKVKPDRFLTDIWLNSLDAFEGNPIVVGFITEQACLSAISTYGFAHRGLDWGNTPTTIFSGNLFETLPKESSKRFYVPTKWNYEHIDALYLDVDSAAKTVLVVPFQITLNKKHKDSEALFYAGWAQWQSFYDGYTLSSTFVWVVQHERSWKMVEETLKTLRSGSKLIAPSHKQIHIAVSELHAPLGRRLDARSHKSKGKMRARQELTQGVEESVTSQDSSDVIKSVPDDNGGRKRARRTNAGANKVFTTKAAKKAKV